MRPYINESYRIKLLKHIWQKWIEVLPHLEVTPVLVRLPHRVVVVKPHLTTPNPRSNPLHHLTERLERGVTHDCGGIGLRERLKCRHEASYKGSCLQPHLRIRSLVSPLNLLDEIPLSLIESSLSHPGLTISTRDGVPVHRDRLEPNLVCLGLLTNSTERPEGPLLILTPRKLLELSLKRQRLIL